MRPLSWFSLFLSGAALASPITFTDSECRQPPKNVVEAEYLGDPTDYARDSFCARRVLERSAPKGFVAVFGSARLSASHDQYKRAYRFAQAWTQRHPEIPILTGAGPGLMEAANKGARDAGGKSLGFGTRFGKQGVEKPNAYMTDFLEFSDFALRESWMINPARAIVIGSGGVGTGWEIFEAISKKQTGKIGPIPLIFLGTRAEWAALQRLLDAMERVGTIHTKDKAILKYAATVEQAIGMVEAGL